MKLYSLKFTSALLLVASASLVGCLKDKSYNNGSIQSLRNAGGTNQNVVEIQLTATSTVNFLLTAFEATNTDTVFNLIPVVLASPGVAKEDVNVTLVLNPTLLTDYNAANGTNYTPAPTGIYTILNANNVVTIPAGSRVGYLKIKFKPVDFLGHEYAFGYSIGSIDKQGYLISGNLQNGIAAIGIKNKYDGRYELRGFHNRPGLDLPYDETVDMITSAQDKVYMYWVGQGPYHPLNAGTTAYGSFTVEFQFNTTTNALIGINNLATPGSPVFTIGPATTSRFDPATKTIYAQYYYNGNLQRVFTDTLFYISPRP